MDSSPADEGPALWLHVVSPLFTGQTPDETVLLRRKAALFEYEQSPARDALDQACGKGTGRGGRASLHCYFPGREISIRHRKDQDPIRVCFPSQEEAAVPKGFVARLHLLVLLESIDRDEVDPANVIFAHIDGSGAFKYDSLRLLVEPFKRNADVDVVFGRRPAQNSGMPPGRKEIEEFEQYLLFRHRSTELNRTFSEYSLDERLLPDGQAGCWAFRLSAAYRLPLTASSYEIEFDLLASVLDAGLKAAYTEPLLMSTGPRHSSASTQAVGMSIKKLNFIQRKLRISCADIAEGWREFARHFGGSPLMDAVPTGYEEALMDYCDSATELALNKEGSLGR